MSGMLVQSAQSGALNVRLTWRRAGIRNRYLIRLTVASLKDA